VSDSILTRRRRFLQGAGIGSATLLAGCAAFDSDNATSDPDDGSDGSDDGTSDDGGTANDNGGDENDDGTSDDGGGENDGSETQDGDEESDDEEPEEPGEGERQAGVVAALGQAEQQAIQQIQLQLREGSIDQDQAETEIQSVLQPVLEDLTAVIESDVGGSVVETVPVLGAVRVNAPPDALIDVLELDETDMLVASSELDIDGADDQGT